MPLITGKQTVPDRMIGCWIRRYIQFSGGTRDTTTRVIWVQTASGMADMRIGADRPAMRHRARLADCSATELLALAQQDCSCATTILDESTTPYPTATWPRGTYGFANQPVQTFPEPGWFAWREDGDCMMEWAPSGAYEEDWRLQPHSLGFAIHLVRVEPAPTTCLYIAGDYAIMARDRSGEVEEKKPLPQLVAARLQIAAPAVTLLDGEFFFAQRQSEQNYEIQLSSLPWSEGARIDLSWAVTTSGDGAHRTDPDGHIWRVESLWSATFQNAVRNDAALPPVT
jgi:hypothetical protein